MPLAPSAADEERPATRTLATMLECAAAGDDDYWSFEDRDSRPLVHSLFGYPAMMVPALHRQLLETLTRWDPSISVAYDPFVGSGTVLTEAMLLGLDFFGCDINPLAVLVAGAKSDMCNADHLGAELPAVVRRARSGRRADIELDAERLDKWFAPHVADGLAGLRYAVSECPGRESRRFWWVALAETVRLTSNSRTSTTKLHMRPAGELSDRPDPVAVFERIASRNVAQVRQQQQSLACRGLLDDGRYRGEVALRHGDVADMRWGKLADVVVTSPPYGDNHTTVAYGQSSYLPLRCIDRDDIGISGDAYVENTHRIDTVSLGGSRRSRRRSASLLDRSAHLRSVKASLAGAPADRFGRIAGFYGDLDARLGGIVAAVRPGGVLSWTTGARTVGGVTVEMAPILTELLADRVEFVAAIGRRIPPSRKRMPARNAVSGTILSETILVVRKAPGPASPGVVDDAATDLAA